MKQQEVLITSNSTNVYVSGTYEFVYDEPTVVEPRGGFCYMEVVGTYPFSGDLEGTAVFDFQVISHGPCETAAPFANQEDLRGHGTFTGRALGKKGTLELDYAGMAWPAEVGEQAVKSEITILSGTAELAGMRGKLFVTYLMGDTFDTYEGQVQFE